MANESADFDHHELAAPPVPAAQPAQSAVLNYTSLAVPAPRFRAMDIVWPFAAGALLPFIMLGILDGLREGLREDLIFFGLTRTWGECGALLLAIKLRSLFVELAPGGRRWRIDVLAGSVNTIAVAVAVNLTTGRQEFWPLLGQWGSITAGWLSAGVIAFVTATVLTPAHK